MTAGTGGIGLEAALGLATAGCAVTVVGRNAERGAAAVEQIAAVATAGNPVFVQADLVSLGETRELAARLAAAGPLTVLVHNVGAMYAQRQRTVDGIEATFAVNHLSPYLLTELLLESLRATGRSRIVNVSSSAVRAANAPSTPLNRRGVTTASTGTAAPNSPTRSTWRSGSGAPESPSSRPTPAAPRRR